MKIEAQASKANVIHERLSLPVQTKLVSRKDPSFLGLLRRCVSPPIRHVEIGVEGQTCAPTIPDHGVLTDECPQEGFLDVEYLAPKAIRHSLVERSRNTSEIMRT